MYSCFILKRKGRIWQVKEYNPSVNVLGGPRKVVSKWSQDQALFESWRHGQTGYRILLTVPSFCFSSHLLISVMVNSRYPLIDANMKELLATGFMSNRGRQVIFFILPIRSMTA